jgi:hypothetical protein
MARPAAILPSGEVCLQRISISPKLVNSQFQATSDFHLAFSNHETILKKPISSLENTFTNYLTP